jgi:hypothetical protein
VQHCDGFSSYQGQGYFDVQGIHSSQVSAFQSVYAKHSSYVRIRILIIILGFDCKVNKGEGCRGWCRTGWGSESREIVFIKLSTLRDNGFLGSRVVKQPTLVSSRVTNENTFLHVGLKQFPLIFLDIDIGSTPPDSEMLDIRLSLEPIVMRGQRSASSRNAIPNMHMCI